MYRLCLRMYHYIFHCVDTNIYYIYVSGNFEQLTYYILWRFSLQDTCRCVRAVTKQWRIALRRCRSSRRGIAEQGRPRCAWHGPSLVLAHARGSDVMDLRPKLASSACRAVVCLPGSQFFFVLRPYRWKNTGYRHCHEVIGVAWPRPLFQRIVWCKCCCMHLLFSTPCQPVITVS